MNRIHVVGLLALLFGCDLGTASPGADAIPQSGSELSLRGFLPEDAALVGFTIAPNGKRYVLDRYSGIYELNDTGATLVWNTSGLLILEPTDFVALENDVFAVTMTNDGYRFDLRDHSFSSYFCYLPLPPPPESEPMSISQLLQQQGVAVEQRTESVAFNQDTQQLFAQPRTTRLDTGVVAGSELFVFSQAGGEPVQVLTLDPSFVAGGMVASGGRLILGANHTLYEAQLSGEFYLVQNLADSVQITGMARAPNNELWVLDGPAQRLLKVEESF